MCYITNSGKCKIRNKKSLQMIPGKSCFSPEGVSSVHSAFTALFGMGRGGSHYTESPGNIWSDFHRKVKYIKYREIRIRLSTNEMNAELISTP